jgi:EAL domain-containing protein (putative c-di-GMP-specific phosphodiesterase class I)
MSSNRAAATQDYQPVEALAQIFAQRVEAALPVMYARWLSLHDASGTLHWQSGEAPGPDEREGVRAALESFSGQVVPARLNYPLRNDRSAVLLRATDMFGDFTGFVMMVVDNRRLCGKGSIARDLPLPVLRAVRDWGTALARLASAVHVATDPEPNTTAANLDSYLSATTAETEQYSAELRTVPFALYSQQLVSLQSGARLCRHEVFMRPGNDVGGNTSPEALLLQAEQRKLGSVLDRRVLSELVAWLGVHTGTWSTQPAEFSVNLSATTLRDPNFPGFVEQCLKEAQLPAGLVAFEVDQALCRCEPRRIEALATQLEKAGAGLIIDDFSLHDDSISLLMLPGLRLVKIDRRLTGEALGGTAGKARISGIAHMARVAGVHSVAKKVDGEQEHELLAVLGVDFLQGFAAAVPVPLDALDT